MYPLKSKSISNLNRHQHFYGCDDLAKYSNWLVFVFFALFLKISIVNPKFKAKIGSSPQHENMFIFEKSNHIYTKCMAGKNNLTEPSKKKKSETWSTVFGLPVGKGQRSVSTEKVKSWANSNPELERLMLTVKNHFKIREAMQKLDYIF